jgi:kexin
MAMNVTMESNGLMAGGGASRSGRNGGRGRGTTRELYDAFGEVSDDDDDDANEETRLHPSGGRGRDERREIGGNELGFHSGFLDDDEPTPSVAGSTPAIAHYRDEPDN